MSGIEIYEFIFGSDIYSFIPGSQIIWQCDWQQLVGQHTIKNILHNFCLKNRCKNISDSQRRAHCGMAVALDEAIGNISRTMEVEGFLNNTLIIFTTDNGGPTNKGSSNWPLRGAKTTLWEGYVSHMSSFALDPLPLHAHTLLRICLNKYENCMVIPHLCKNIIFYRYQRLIFIYILDKFKSNCKL